MIESLCVLEISWCDLLMLRFVLQELDLLMLASEAQVTIC